MTALEGLTIAAWALVVIGAMTCLVLAAIADTLRRLEKRRDITKVN